MRKAPTRGEVLDALGRWLLLVVGVSLLPILLNWLGGLTAGPHVHFTALFRHGELLIVACAILGAGLYELFARKVPSDLRRQQGWLVGWAGLTMVGCALWFALIQSDIRSKSEVDYHFVWFWSLVVFGLALVTSGSCFVLSLYEELQSQ